jgi:ankyrin repeat domain-containing protein 17
VACLIIQILLAASANVDNKGVKADCTPLMEAASAGNVDIVNLLIEHQADVNAKSAAGL